MTLTADREERLDRFLARMLPEHSRTRLAKLVEEGLVKVDDKTTRPAFKLEPGMSIELDEPEAADAHDLTPAEIPLDIRYEDDDLLVVNKPRGLAAHPAASLKEPSLVNALLGRNIELSKAGGDFRPGIVHRLDKDTTGLMVVAKNDQAHVKLAKQMETKSAERRYFAVVGGSVEQERFKIEAPIGRNKHNRLLMAIDAQGKPAVTHIKRLGRSDHGYVLGARLETGRTHQIRVHLRAVGLPVLGDKLYAPKEMATGPLQLHAAYLAFDHPSTGERVVVYVDPDESFYGRDLVSMTDLEHF